MVQCRKCGKWFEPTTALTDLCHACQQTITVSAGTTPLLTTHDKLLALGWEKTYDDLQYQKILKQNNYQRIYEIININKKAKTFSGTWFNDNYFNCSYTQHSLDFDLKLAKILVEYLEELE